jgi:hypothetical protein
MQSTFTLPGMTVRLPSDLFALAEATASEMMDAQPLRYLARALVAYPWSAGDIVVEIGAYIGPISTFMAQVLGSLGRRNPMLSIDPFERATADDLNPQGSYAGYLETIRRSDVADRCLPLVGFLQDAAPAVPNRIGAIPVDGDHHATGIVNDLRLYVPKVLPHRTWQLRRCPCASPATEFGMESSHHRRGPMSIWHRPCAFGWIDLSSGEQRWRTTTPSRRPRPRPGAVGLI